MIIVFYAYCAFTLLVGLRFAWHMIFKLDRYDWDYSKGNIWMSFALSVVFWPLLLIRPRILIDPGKLFEGNLGMAARMRERDQLLKNPPPCGSMIRYRQESGWYTEVCGEFLFQASQVEQAIRQRLTKSPKLLYDDEGAILNWICRRDKALNEPTDVPEAWTRFEFVANDLIRAGNASAKCLKCGIDIDQNKIVTDDDHGRPGWNCDRLVCPNGHNLLVVRKTHILRRSS